MSPGTAASGVDRFIADPDATGPEAPPRKNGELVFEAPWEGRAFGLALTLAREGVCDWEDFRRRLMEEIGTWEDSHAPDSEEWSYYERWLASLERLLLDGGLLRASEIDARMAEIADREAHEHDHEHDHDHHDAHAEVS